jgi:hypothetical protein
MLCVVRVAPYLLHCSQQAVTAPLFALGNQVMANESMESAELLYHLEVEHKVADSKPMEFSRGKFLRKMLF